MKVGDTIECRDKADMVETMYQLQREGIETDFVYELDGKKGLRQTLSMSLMERRDCGWRL